MSFTGKSDNYLTTTLANNGFFPDVSLGDYQRLYRVPAEYHQDKVEHHLRLAMVDVNTSLSARQAVWQEAGYADLAAVPGDDLGTANALVEQYQRAVFGLATATLFAEFATITRREIGENQAKENDSTAQYYRAASNRALRKLLGIPTNITAELL